MTEPADQTGEGLFLLVPGTMANPEEESYDEPEDDGVEEQGPRWDRFVRKVVERRTADLAQVRIDLEKVQRQARQLLASLSVTRVGDMRLDEVEFSIGINAEGSLGVVTAGVEASIALTYRRVDPVADYGAS